MASLRFQLLFAFQEENHAAVLRKLRCAKTGDRALVWDSLAKEVSQGFGVVHRQLPRPGAVPDVLLHRFVARQDKWDYRLILIILDLLA